MVQERSSWGGCKLEGERWCNASTGYDIALEVTENVNTDTLLSLRLQDTLYSAESTALLLRSYVNVLDYIIDTADALVENIPTWSPQDTHAASMAGKGKPKPNYISSLSPTPANLKNYLTLCPQERPLEPTWGQTIVHRIDQMVTAHGSRTALKDGNGKNLTYDQMNERVSAITERLLASSTAKGLAVGVFQQPSVDWICSMLAIFKAGAVYVPLDMRNSIPRLRAVVQAARPTLILTDNATTAKVHHLEATTATEIVVSDVRLPSSPQLNRAEHDAVAVILFTSGSTGEPKGIMLNHTNLVSFAEASSQIFAKSDSGIKVLQQSPFSFDFSLDQTFAALGNGGCLYIVSASHRGDPSEISRIMIEEEVSYTTATPSEYDMWLRYAGNNLKRCSSWNYAFSGGEAMSYSLAREFLSLKIPNLRLFNGYGPAETTILSTKIELAENKLLDPLPAGFMLPGFPVCIVDAELQPVPLGVSGEIVIGGACVASGYLGDAELTGRKFIPDAFFRTSRPVYRSGDRGRLFGDGTLFCDGRLDGDTQIKLRGFRVELVEVEKAMVRYASGALSHAIVTLRGSGEARHLAAHVVFGPDYPTESQGEVLKKLRQSLPLPPYMRPAVITPLSDIPRTPHGKVDRKAVQDMSLPKLQEEPEIAFELTDTERKLAELWRQVLPVVPGPISPESDFFVFGGNSILLVKLQSMIMEAHFEAPKLVTLMGATSLSAMATVIESKGPSVAIDWEAETRLPESMFQRTVPSQQAPPHPNPEALTVLLTGATGYLGRHLLAELIKDPKIVRIVALVRHAEEGLHTGLAKKVTVLQTNISHPLLGLSDDSFETLAEETDAIIHCAANRSFWDRYEVLRPDNVEAVKHLALLAAHRSIPLHLMSSGAVASYGDSEAIAPPHDGRDGYVTTKWVAELFLKQAASTLHIPAHIHRPLGVPSGSRSKSTGSDSAYQTRVINQLTAICNQLGARPSFDGVRGTVDVAPIDRIVQDIQIALHSSISSGILCGDDARNPVHIVQHNADLQLSVEDFAAHVQANNDLRNLPPLQILEWFGRAKKSGFGFFMTAQHLIMGGLDEGLVSVR